MALISDGFWLTFTVADNGDNRGTLEFQGDPAVLVDFATALLESIAMIADFQAISEGTITGYAVSERFFEDTLVLPASNVELENKASITYQIAGTNKKGNIKVPTPEPATGVVFVSNIGASANQVNTGSTLLSAYFDNFRAGGGFLISDGEKAGTILVGKRISAKNNNG